MRPVPVINVGLAVALLLIGGGTQADTVLGLALRAESAELRDNSLFAAPTPYRGVYARAVGEELYIRHAQSGAVVEWAGTRRERDGLATTRGRLNELYLDFSTQGIDFTVGKKVMSFGVGHGFRPLDVIQREARRSLFEERLEGVPIALVERLDADSSISAIYVNRVEVDDDRVRRGPHEGVLRHYRYWGALETHALLHWHEARGAAPGGGFSWVHGDHLEVHGAFLYQDRYHVPSHRLTGGDTRLADRDPWRLTERRGGHQLLLGTSATAGGYTLLLEGWHDDEAFTAGQWRELRTLAAEQQGLLGLAPERAVYGNLAWNQRAYAPASLLPDNLLLRLSHDGVHTDPYLDLLTTPEDGGYVATLGLDHEWRQGITIRAGIRGFGGPSDSAYGQMPQRSVAFLELHGEMVW